MICYFQPQKEGKVNHNRIYERNTNKYCKVHRLYFIISVMQHSRQKTKPICRAEYLRYSQAGYFSALNSTSSCVLELVLVNAKIGRRKKNDFAQ